MNNEGLLLAAEETQLLHHEHQAQHDDSTTFDEFSSIPVTNDQSWVRVALIFVTAALSLPSFVAGMDVFATQPSLVFSAAAIGCGNGMLALVASVTGMIGSKTRRNSYGLARIAFGDYGAALLNGIFCLALLGWFGVNLNIFSQCIIVPTFHENYMLMLSVELMGGLVMTLTTMYGIQALERVSLFLAPVLAIVTVLLITKASTTLTKESLREQLDTKVSTDDRVEENDMNFGQAISSVVGLSIIGAIIAPDYTRFIRESRGAAYLAFVSFAITASVVQFAGGIASVAFRSDNLFDILVGIGWQWEAYGVIIASSWILNTMNLYSAALSFKATVPTSMGSSVSVGILGALGTLIAFANILDSFLSFLFYLSVAFAPVAAVIAVDYTFLRRHAYDARGGSLLERYTLRPVSLLAWMLGVTTAVLGSINVVRVTGIAALDALIVSGITYYTMSRVCQ
jgi:cytosine permease